MLKFEIDDYWTRRLDGARPVGKSQLSGWIGSPANVDSFVEPALSLLEGDPETAKILVVSAPGAVGKSTFACKLGQKVNFAVVDLSKTSPLGGNFFKGGLANAFGMNALTAAANGSLGLIVDALDEGQLRTTPQAFEAGLTDLATVATSAGARPTVLFGRALAAEDAYLIFSLSGYSACLFQIEFFDEARSKEYLSQKLPVIARRSESVRAAFASHRDSFTNLAYETRSRLTSVQGGGEPRFVGYAPVLDAICEFTLDPEELNPQARLASLDASSQIKLIRDITRSILDREQTKLVRQLSEQHSDLASDQAKALYTPDEQLRRVAAAICGDVMPIPTNISDPTLQKLYLDMVAQFMPQHPFLNGASGPANLVFAAHVVVWALTVGGKTDVARKAIRTNPNLVSGVLFELYANWLEEDNERVLPLVDVGILYQALASQVTARQRVSLEIDEEGEVPSLAVQFEILERTDPNTGIAQQGQVWGPFPSSNETLLELRTPISNVFIEAPIWVELGDGTFQQIGAPTAIEASQLTISAKQVLVHPGANNTVAERQTVSLIAGEAECQTVQTISVKDATLAVAWPGARRHPWTPYVTEPPTAVPEIDFMRRRLRAIFNAFRSHSRGNLVRLAAKIDHSRMTKDVRGVALLEQLLRDRILILFDAGKFYALDSDRMGQLLGVDYQSLQQKRFTAQSDDYLANVLTRTGN